MAVAQFAIFRNAAEKYKLSISFNVYYPRLGLLLEKYVKLYLPHNLSHDYRETIAVEKS